MERRHTYVFDFASRIFEGRVLTDFGPSVEAAQLFNRLLEVVLKLLEHDQARNAVVIINESRVLIAQVLVRHLHLVKVVLVSYVCLLAVLSARCASLLVRMRHKN